MEVLRALILWGCVLDVVVSKLSAVGNHAQRSIPSPQTTTNIFQSTTHSWTCVESFDCDETVDNRFVTLSFMCWKGIRWLFEL